MKSIIALTLILFMSKVLALDKVDDTDLMHLLTGEENVVALFTKNNCPQCDELETIVENILNELKETLGAVVVKAHNSQLVGIYNPAKEPSVIYFRRGIPLPYYGELNEELIVRKFSENRDPVVKELSDENFEHLTQASTGATTGDWFIFFYSADCVFCQRLYGVWEAVGAHLRHRLNVARINRMTAGRATAKRFGVVESPEFLLIRQGKFYRYKVKDYTPAKFIDFVEQGYRKQLSPDSVPPIESPINDFYAKYVKILIENSQFLLLASIVLAVIVAIVYTLRRVTKTNSKKQKTAKKAK